MPQKAREIMTPNPITAHTKDPTVEAARAMRDAGVGPVIVLDDKDKVCGIVTDRDITIRVVAENKDPSKVKLGEICSKDLTTVKPDEDVDRVISLMREKSIRRVPVVDGKKVVGIIAMGDLAIENDPRSALADVSAAPPND